MSNQSCEKIRDPLDISKSVRTSPDKLRTDFLVQIGKRIKIVRGNLLQKDFAKQIGIHQNSLSQYEAGKREPGAEIISKMVATFDVAPQWLLTGEGPMKKSDPKPDFNRISASKSFDEKVFMEVFTHIETYFLHNDLEMVPRKKGELILACYEFWLFEEEKNRDITRLFRLIKIAAA
jgi:transcriptional regulator with XRE-family HTH domain